MTTILHTAELTTLTCGNAGCGIPFAIPTSLYRKAVDDHDIWFWCPNGHCIHFYGESEAEKARRRAAYYERRAANADEDARAARASLIATKGHLTRAKRRADAGVCQHCKRTFANVARHVAHMHPEAGSSASKETPREPRR